MSTIASIEGHQDIVKLLIQNKADVNAKTQYGNTALMFGNFFFFNNNLCLIFDHAYFTSVILWLYRNSKNIS